MRVFVTGASGWIGSALLPELIDAGHEVVGLARSDASAAVISAAGAKVQRGSIDDLDTLREGTATADGVVHLAFKHDFGDYAGAGAADLSAVGAMGSVLAGSGKPLVITSGTLMLTAIAPGRVGTEHDIAGPEAATLPRIASEGLALALAGRGVRTSIVRLAPTVHGQGDRGFVPIMIDAARKNGVSAYVGDGSNRWPAVHRLDAARLFRLAVEAAPAGSVLHGAAEQGVPLRDVAGVIGRQLGVPVASITQDEAAGHFGFLGAFVSLDNPTSSTSTQELLNWRPVHPGLIADLEEGHYVAPEARSKYSG
jgi:nucleoside-diphosphate-sugar epimerase